MTTTGRVGIGIPGVLLYEGEGHTIGIETKDGTTYMGVLRSAEDNMNVLIQNATVRDSKGNKKQVPYIYLRGDQVVYFSLPEVLSNAPVFKRLVKHKETKGKFTPQGSGTTRASRMQI
eukprot:maker-scaffold_18-snap-gene-5.0-mRNA-1 protein AED:0.02 eAED:0.02 QI:111/1/1/1/0/0/3/756/117